MQRIPHCRSTFPFCSGTENQTWKGITVVWPSAYSSVIPPGTVPTKTHVRRADWSLMLMLPTLFIGTLPKKTLFSVMPKAEFEGAEYDLKIEVTHRPTQHSRFFLECSFKRTWKKLLWIVFHFSIGKPVRSDICTRRSLYHNSHQRMKGAWAVPL